MSAAGKRCHYEVMGVSRESTPDEIRSAYKKLALQRHPDKLVRSGLSQAEATAQFQELVHAYEILSDPKERAWYDSHRSQILFSSHSSTNSAVPNSVIPNLFSFFSNTVYSGFSDSGKGFYKVYSDVFGKIYENEINYCRKLGLELNNVREAPLMGNLDSPYAQTTAFYGYWLAFATVMDFAWVSGYDAMMGPNRKSRRVMEEENKKVRRKARREYNETVRGLAAFVKKRDKRVRDEMLRRAEEMERKKAEERERKKAEKRERKERAREFEEPEWARVEEELEQGWEEEEEGKEGKEEFYCVVCGKKFKSDKQWRNHEQSKKHKEKVAELKEALGGEDGDDDDEEEEEMNDGVDEMEERFQDGFTNREEENEVEVGESTDKEDDIGVVDLDNGEDEDEDEDNDDGGDRERNVLEGMMSRQNRRSRKSACSRQVFEDLPQKVHVEDQSEEGEAMEYNKRKTRRRRAKKDSGKHKSGEPMRADNIDGNKSSNEETNVHDDDQVEESASRSRHVYEDLPQEVHVEDESEEGGAMEYNKRKPRRRRAKKDGGKHKSGVHMRADNIDENKSSNEETNVHDDDQVDESASYSFVKSAIDDNSEKNRKSSNQSVDKKGVKTKETKANSKNSSKGKKGKGASKNSSNSCETCGEEFESRNKLHRHLGDTGHSALKFR